MDLQVAAQQQLGYGHLVDLVPADEEIPVNYGHKMAIFRARNHAVAPNSFGTSPVLGADSQQQYVIVVLPGGGYEFLSYREDRKVALAFARMGFDAVVLHYHTKYVEEVRFSHRGVGHDAMVDVAMMIDELRRNSHLGMQHHKIVLCGFSAGGHLAASLCTLYNDPELTTGAAWNGSLRPDGAILCYPVISARPDLAHVTSFTCFTGSERPSDWQHYSCEQNVTSDTPPAFIWHTVTDTTVPYANSLVYAQAMWEHGCKAQLVLFPQGEHGSSLATREVELNNDFAQADPLIATWLTQAAAFVRRCV